MILRFCRFASKTLIFNFAVARPFYLVNFFLLHDALCGTLRVLDSAVTLHFRRRLYLHFPLRNQDFRPFGYKARPLVLSIARYFVPSAWLRLLDRRGQYYNRVVLSAILRWMRLGAAEESVDSPTCEIFCCNFDDFSC